ncbi:MAG: hypothetical protein J5493_03240 [Lachnospiraceae bacterium]|nr:hypothetical protein [Lachnospiraceae bacterium]
MATNYDKLLERMRTEAGMDYRWSAMFVKKLRDDEAAFPVPDEDKKRWALERGFYPGRIELYGLTEDNYMQYMPDFQYFMLHPLNNHFLKWLDKTTLKYVMNSGGVEDTMPKYYAYVENELCRGRYTYLMDCPRDIPRDKDFLWNLLKRQGVLALKPNSGTSGGFGFMKLELRGDELYENNKRIGMDRFEEIRDTIRNYIITEYCYQNHELAKIWPDSECTLRVTMCKDYTEDKFAETTWTCAISFARFGSVISGGASNLSSGGVGIGFDFKTGKYKDYGLRYRRFTPDGNWMLDRHPDTNAQWKGDGLPNWEFVRSKIEAVCQHVSSLDYMGMDVIITEEGMIICEINSHPAMDYAQVMCSPVLSIPKVREFFEHKGLRKQDPSVFCRAYFDSQE